MSNIDKKDSSKNLLDKKARIESALSLNHGGPLYIDPKYMKPDFHYCLPTTRPGEIDYYQRLGYEVVKDEIVVGDQTARESSPLGGAVTVQSKCGATHVLMAIHKDDYTLIQDVIKQKNQEYEKSIGHLPGINPTHMLSNTEYKDKA